ncbi:MAG: RNA polymerase sigma factor [Chitinophagales bacterium]|nr:RNA polymerase sigma factor [Chitinophagales bacterium]
MNYLMDITMPDNRSLNITETVKKYSAQLLGFIRGKVKLLEDAEDVMQDVWYQFSNLADTDEIQSVSGWLYRVARNKITDRYRKQTNDLLDDYLYEDEDGNLSLKDILLADEHNDPELSLFRDTFWDVFMEAIQELPENQRKVFVLNELEGKTLQQIADEEGVPLKTIISRKGYAVKHLRKHLLPLYEELNK